MLILRKKGEGIGVKAFLVGTDELDEDVACVITKAIYDENGFQEFKSQDIPALTGLTRDDLKPLQREGFPPIHKGSARAFAGEGCIRN